MAAAKKRKRGRQPRAGDFEDVTERTWRRGYEIPLDELRVLVTKPNGLWRTQALDLDIAGVPSTTRKEAIASFRVAYVDTARACLAARKPLFSDVYCANRKAWEDYEVAPKEGRWVVSVDEQMEWLEPLRNER